jgi:hypothetical protein
MYKILFSVSAFMLFFGSLFGQKPLVAADSSALATYYALGMPIVNRMWLPKDYTKAVEIIEQIKKTDINQLPRKKSGAASAIFDKLTNIERYEVLDKRIYNDNMRFVSMLELVPAMQKLMFVYLTDPESSTGKLQFSNEISATFISTLFLTEQMSAFAEKIMKDKTDLSEKQKKGLEQVRYGLNSILDGMLTTIATDYPAFEREDIEALSEYFFPFYQRVNIFLDLNARQEFTKRISAIAATHAYEEVKQLALATK